MSDFNVEAVLAQSVDKIKSQMANFTLEQLGQLEKVESDKAEPGRRTTLLTALAAEITARLLDAEEAAAPAGATEPETLLPDVAVLHIAAECHEMNRAYCLSLGDDSQLPWDDAPEWQQASAIAGVEFHLANPDADDATSHESWTAQKLADGWTYGEVKDADKKTHPCLVPFDHLPSEQQFKDALFRRIVWMLAPLMNLLGTPEPATLEDADGMAGAEPFASFPALAFCDASDAVIFHRAVRAQDFDQRRNRAVYRKAVELTRDMPIARVKHVLLLDPDGGEVARITLATELVGGAGRSALFPAGSLAFDAPTPVSDAA